MSQKPTHQLPCDYVIKIVGHYDFDFSEEILAIIKSKMTVKAHHTTASSNKSYLSLSVTLYLEDEQLLAEVLKDVKAKPYIKMVL